MQTHEVLNRLAKGIRTYPLSGILFGRHPPPWDTFSKISGIGADAKFLYRIMLYDQVPVPMEEDAEEAAGGVGDVTLAAIAQLEADEEIARR